MTTLVTGASGLVGNAMVELLVRNNVDVRVAIRAQSKFRPEKYSNAVPAYTIKDVGPETDWSAALDGAQSVIHLAARAHIMNETASDPLTEFRRINTSGTTRLALMAAQAGVRRFVYVSTIKVNGESTTDAPFQEDDAPRPSDPYAISKWEAELALRGISAETGMQIVVVRPPLVYGPGVGGNFLTMLKWMDYGIPLPLAAVDNLRSLVGIDNLVNMLMSCLTQPHASGELFLVSDGEDLSTPELLRRTALFLGKSSRLFPFPVRLMRSMARLFAKDRLCERLCGSLAVDSSKARRVLGWKPVSSVDDELRRTIEWYLHRSSSAL